jgi:hypothetical protein
MESPQKSPRSVSAIVTSTDPTTASPFQLNLNHVKLPRTITHISKREREKLAEHGIFDEYTFCHILGSYTAFDIFTYSVSRSMPIAGSRINRLIYSVGQPPIHVKQTLRLEGTHVKLWICSNSKDTHAYVGSCNATDLTIHDLLIRADPKQTKLLIAYFNSIWDLNQPKS